MKKPHKLLGAGGGSLESGILCLKILQNEVKREKVDDERKVVLALYFLPVCNLELGGCG